MPTIEPARVVRIRPSPLQRWALVGIALLACAAIALADLPPAGIVAAALFTAFITRQAWRRSEAVALRLHGDGSLELRAAGQDWQPAVLLPRSSVTPWLCVLAYRSEGKTHSLALYPDSLHPDDFRHLRVWLRWRAQVAGDEHGEKKQSASPPSTTEAHLSLIRRPTEEGKKTSLPQTGI